MAVPVFTTITSSSVAKITGAALNTSVTANTAAAVSGVPGEIPGVSSFFPFFAPSFDAALAASVVFTAMLMIHIWILFKTKAWYFAILAQAALILAGGMITRLIFIAAPTATLSFAVSTILLMIPGTLLAISIIFTYTRLIWWITPLDHRNSQTLWLPFRITSILIAGAQMVAEVMMTIGMGQVTKTTIPRLVSSGAVLEMLVWMFLTVLVARFTLISRRWPMDKETRQGSLELGLALVGSSLLLSIRGIMQVLEKDAAQALIAMQMPTSIVSTEEWPTYVFDLLPSFGIIITLGFYHPGYYLPRSLMGFRLNSRELLKAERRRKENADGGVSKLSNGLVIGRPKPAGSDYEKGAMGVYARAIDSPILIGYAK